MGILTQAIGLIFSLSILVFFHELGHFFFARLFKTRVEKFYLFFNPYFSIIRAKRVNGKWNFSFFSKKSPEAWSEYPDQTEWGLGWLPLGGYCSIAGMIDETKTADNLASEPQPWEYRSKKTWQRFFIITGGVLTNFVMALVIYSMIIFSWGDNYIPIDKTPLYFSEVGHNAGLKDKDIILLADGDALKRYDNLELFKIIDAKTLTVLRDGREQTISLPKDFSKQILASKSPLTDFAPASVDSIIPGSIAEKSGLQQGDRIVSIDNKETTPFAVFATELKKHAGEDIQLGVIRNNQNISLNIRPDDDGKIGFTTSYKPTFITSQHGFFSSIPAGASYCIRKLSFYVQQLKFIFTKEGVSQMGGFGAIGSMFPKAWDWAQFWSNTALISIILAFMNILPIPALDGGHMLFILVEMITGRKPSDKFLERAQMVGFFILLSLLIYANGMDIMRLFK